MRLSKTSDSPTAPSGAVGTVTSFTNGVLTITLNDGTAVSGKVTSDTEIECQSSMGDDDATDNNSGDEGTSGDDQASGGDDQASGGDDQASGGDDQSEGGDDQGEGSDDQGEGSDDQGDNDEDQGDDDANGPACGTSSLTANAPVLGAELEITSAGATWSDIELG